MIDYRIGDTREVVAAIPDGTVSLVATSPPFLALRSYLPADHDAKHAEIGSEPDPATFIDTLLGLTAEWGRVLAPWGSIAIELGDTYSGSGGAGGDYNEGGLRDGQGKFAGSARKERNRPRDDRPGRLATDTAHTPRYEQAGGPGWPAAKSLALIPQLYAIALAYGRNPLTGTESPAGRWRVRNVIVWHRPNPAVGALGDKYRPSTSYIVVATKDAKRWFDLTAVRHEAIDQRTRTTNGQKKGPADEVLCSNYDQRVPSNPAGAPPLDCWTDEYDYSHDTWTVTTQPSSLAHYAMWPARLAERLVLSMCPAEVCTACGTPRRRVEGAAEYVQSRHGKTPATLHMRDGKQVAVKVRNWSANGATQGDNSVTRTAPTLGWTDCGCGAPWTPGTVLDPFCGTGTTLCVAHLHGRDAIGVDLDPRNRSLLERRQAEVTRNLFGTKPQMPGQLGMFDEGAA